MHRALYALAAAFAALAVVQIGGAFVRATDTSQCGANDGRFRCACAERGCWLEIVMGFGLPLAVIAAFWLAGRLRRSRKHA